MDLSDEVNKEIMAAPQALDDAAAEEIATQLFEQLEPEHIIVLLANGGAQLACDDNDKNPFSQEFMDMIAARLNELLKASQSAPRSAAFEVTKRFALRRTFMIFGKLDDEDALWDSLEGNGVNIWRCHVKLGCYESDEYKGYGWFFLTTPRWSYVEEVDRAIATYYNKMCWKYPEYRDYCMTEMSYLLYCLAEDFEESSSEE